jgi:hypothetical protein
VDVDDVADDVPGSPLLARRLVGPVVRVDEGDQRLEAIGEMADAVGDGAHWRITSPGSDEAPAEERPEAACVAGERN